MTGTIIGEMIEIDAILRRQRNPDAGADMEFMPVDAVRRADFAHDAVSENLRFSRHADVRLQDDEFIAAQSRGGVALAQRTGHSHGDHLQQRVAGGVAVGIVDRLEVIHVPDQ